MICICLHKIEEMITKVVKTLRKDNYNKIKDF